MRPSDTGILRPDDTTESALVAGMRSGDEASFRAFFHEYVPRLFRFVVTRVEGDATAAEEICQMSMTRAMRYIHSYRGEASLFSWLCRIARNEIADLRTRQQRGGIVLPEDDESVRAVLDTLAAPESDAPHARHARDDEARFVHVVLDSLPANYARALELKYLDDLSVDQIAGELRLSVIAAQSLLARARAAFREGFDALEESGHALRALVSGGERS